MNDANEKRGMFITFEGPNGVGKSSVIAGVANQLTQHGLNILQTKEPTLSPLGQFIKSSEENYHGEILACLVAADRYFHLQNEILPAILAGMVVLSDRYVESSLVLQRFDGLDLKFIWELNSRVCIPDLSIILTAPAEILEQRLSKRSSFSRFERTKSRADELSYYWEASEFLSKYGFNILLIDNSATPLNQNVEKIVSQILKLNSRPK